MTHYADDHLSVVTEHVTTPTNAKAKSWTTVRRKHAVVVAAMTREKQLVLIRQERIPIRETIWEMPAGQVDHEQPNEHAIAETALRELQEETGYILTEAGQLTSLGHFFASPGFTNECEHLFLASPVERIEESSREDAIVDCRTFSIDEIHEMIARNEIRDANTLSTFARLVVRKLINLAD